MKKTMNNRNLYVNKKSDAFKHSKSCVRFFKINILQAQTFCFSKQLVKQIRDIHIGLMMTFTILHIFIQMN